ncbi:MAG: branched-chain amino acid ABC transporter permease, partial [Pseudomonadota bacterium]
MLYRESGDFSTTYQQDGQTFPIKFDRYRYYAVMAIAFAIVPFLVNDYWVNAIFLPFLIYSIAAIGLNILTGYCGQVSLGTGGFMAVGAYACYKLMTGFPEINIFFHIILSGGITAAVCVLFGLPSLRIKGFYLAVATLAAQFFLVWMFNKVSWFYNYSASGQINAPERTIFGYAVTGPETLPWVAYLFCLAFTAASAIIARNITRGSTGRKWMFNKVSWFYNYSASGQINAPERTIFGYAVTGPETLPWVAYLFCLAFTAASAIIARNITRGSTGRKWMAIRDMDIAAEIIGVDPLRAKLSAFAVSGFFVGISGALFF